MVKEVGAGIERDSVISIVWAGGVASDGVVLVTVASDSVRRSLLAR